MSATHSRLKINNSTLTNEEQNNLLRRLLPACQPQEGSPTNTFTRSELDDLKKAVGLINIGPTCTSGNLSTDSSTFMSNNKVDIYDVKQAFKPTEINHSAIECNRKTKISRVVDNPHTAPIYPQGGDDCINTSSVNRKGVLDWHGAPRLHKGFLLSRKFRDMVRIGDYTKPTNGICPGFLQCNLVVLPQGPVAFDFLLFCQRNPKTCPLIEVCDVGSPIPNGVAPGADLRTDLPKYSIYRNGKLEKEVNDVTDDWPPNSVAFLIGCSFSYDGALIDAGIPLRSAEQGKNVPMYKTNLRCRSAGSLNGNMVVSMKPIPALQISKHASSIACSNSCGS